jgi:ferredoxin-type protein NapH
MTTINIMLPKEITDRHQLPMHERIGYGMVALAAFLLLLGAFGGPLAASPVLYCLLTIGLAKVGGLIVIVPRFRQIPGIKNNGVMTSGLTRRGLLAWMLGVAFTAFYVVLYWYPEYLGSMTASVDPISWTLRGAPADRWFLYGTLYTVAVLVMGIRMVAKYRHSPYHLVRTGSVMLSQLALAFVLPAILVRLHSHEFYFHYFWPLKPDYLFPSSLHSLFASDDKLIVFMGFWTVMMSFIAVPVLTYFFGKRWYCSWVCGCGALAETMGDPFRQNSDKSLKAWKAERWIVHGVLVFIVLTTALIWLNSWYGGEILGSWSTSFAKAYGFYIGSLFSGVIGVGFYPIMGSRVWCRFGCPQAAILGLLQKWFSRFRITTNGGQCISCGNCSTYCEMGIDVRSYAQRGEDIKRASCVGCGVCASVCPRGVLKLENQ